VSQNHGEFNLEGVFGDESKTGQRDLPQIVDQTRRRVACQVRRPLRRDFIGRKVCGVGWRARKVSSAHLALSVEQQTHPRNHSFVLESQQPARGTLVELLT